MTYPTDTTLAATCDALLIKSNRIYREIENLYLRLHGDLSASNPENVHLTMESLNILFKNAGTIEGMVSESLTQTRVFSDSTKMLLGQRAELLANLHQINRLLSQKAENIKALLRHEITTLSTNQNALKSYKPNYERKCIISNTF